MPASFRLLTQALDAPGLAQLARYVCVSAAALAVDLAAFAAILGSEAVPASLAGALSLLAGLLVHYALAVVVVFDAAATGKSGRRLFAEYLATGLAGFAITATVIFLVSDLAGLPAFAGKALAVAVTFVSVYAMRAGIVFRVRNIRAA